MTATRAAALAFALLFATVMSARQDGFDLRVEGAMRWRQVGPAEGGVGVAALTIDRAFPPNICAARAMAVACAPAWDEPFRASGWRDLPAALAAPVIADPRDPDILYGGDVLRYDRRTTQIVDVRPDGVAGAGTAMVPKAFAADGRTLLVGTTAVYRTTDGGLDWTRTSPDWALLGARITTLTVSPVDARIFWVGLSSGDVRLTRNSGETWHETTAPWRSPASTIRALQGSHFDPESAYAVVAVGGDSRLFRTRDAGSTWVDLTGNIEGPRSVLAIGEDRFRRGLLFAGTEQSVAVSFDDGIRWQPLDLNLPPGPVNAIAIRESDLIVDGSAGVWVLDDFSPLRQLTADISRAPFFLFRPQAVHRVRATAAPVPSAEVEGSAPAAAFTYLVGGPLAEELTIEIIETRTGELIRRWSSHPGANADVRPTEPVPLPTGPGLQRVTWDLRYSPPVAGDAVPGTIVLPGTYQVRLTVDGRMMRQAIAVRIDPRVRASLLDLTALCDLGRAIDGARAAVAAARSGDTATRTEAQARELAALAEELRGLARVLQQADVRPTSRIEAAVERAVIRAAGPL